MLRKPFRRKDLAPNPTKLLDASGKARRTYIFQQRKMCKMGCGCGQPIASQRTIQTGKGRECFANRLEYFIDQRGTP